MTAVIKLHVLATARGKPANWTRILRTAKSVTEPAAPTMANLAKRFNSLRLLRAISRTLDNNKVLYRFLIIFGWKISLFVLCKMHQVFGRKPPPLPSIRRYAGTFPGRKDCRKNCGWQDAQAHP